MMKHRNPPRWAISLFRLFCNDHLSEAVLGDMLELHDRRRLKIGKLKADLLFIWNVLQFIQPFAIRKKGDPSPLNTVDMLSNYFKIAWRTMLRQKIYTAITVGGFALGLATCIMIFLFVKNELSFDKHYKDSERIYRLYNDYTEEGESDKWTNIQTPLPGIMRQELPDIELIARVMSNGFGNSGTNLVRRDDVVENTYEDKFAYADPDLLELLEIPMVIGSSRALDKPYSMVISLSKSKQLFGDSDPVGKVLILEDDKSHPYTVAGVMEDYHRDSHFQFDFLLTLKDFEFWPGEQTNWCCWNYTAYVKLREGVDVTAFEQKLLRIRDNYVISYMEKIGDKSVDDFRKYHAFKMQPVGDIYLHPEINSTGAHGDAKYIWVFSGIALVILALACINFINLSTAKSANRAKEVGLRKAVGSMRRSLIAQFITESILFSMLSFVIAFAIVCVSLPAFGAVSGREIVIPWTSWWLFPSLLGASLAIGLIAGAYPAFYLSAFKPIQVLKGNLRSGSKSSALRSGMVVFQFSTSIVLIIGTLVIYQQMEYLMNRDTGFDKEQVMIIDGTSALGHKRQILKDELVKLSNIESVAVSNYLPLDDAMSEGYGYFREGHEKTDKSVQGSMWRIDPDYISTMRMKIINGRDFDRNIASDSQAMVVNEAMVRELGLKDPIDSRITTGGDKVYTIIGVVEDFNQKSMRSPIRPLGFSIEKGGEDAMLVRINSDIPGTIRTIEDLWRKINPGQPFRYSFFDERFARMYDDVLRMGNLFAAFATLAIIVACLGLFALSAFMSEQRSKEISIRLVMGASVKSIFGLLTGNFMKLVIISWMVGAPLAWYAMNEWLDSFAYREPISSSSIIIAGAIAISIAILTVSYQSIKAALSRPVENLRID